jgi:hypothetical protein
MFTFKLVQPDGSPAEQPTFVTAVPDWHEGDTFLLRPGRMRAQPHRHRLPLGVLPRCLNTASRQRIQRSVGGLRMDVQREDRDRRHGVQLGGDRATKADVTHVGLACPWTRLRRD